MSTSPWTPPKSRQQQAEAGRARRHRTPRRDLAQMSTSGRDPLGILEAQNASRVSELVPLRVARMSASPFAFYRGSAALMAADLASGPHSGILVASCGDAHVANFGFYASPQRTLVFDLNDFDEAAWAPWEWDLKRLVTSIVVAGQATSRDHAVVRRAALAAARTYGRAVARFVEQSPLERYYTHFDAVGAGRLSAAHGGKVVDDAIRHATRRTGERAARKLTETTAAGQLRFIEAPPTTTHASPEILDGVEAALEAYLATTNADIRLLVHGYALADTVRRVVGVGSVGTRCYLTALQDGNGNALLLQTKEAGRSVLAEYGGCPQPDILTDHIGAHGEGARVVALQRVLQGVSDPFLGYMSGTQGDYYMRQFRDMKGGIDAEDLEDEPFVLYARACATILARAHSQSPAIGEVAGYVGGGRAVAEAVVSWAYDYAEISRADHAAFVAAHS